MRTLISVLLVAFIATTTATPATSAPLMHIERSTVTVWGNIVDSNADGASADSGKLPLCSGFVIQAITPTRLRIATASHCRGVEVEQTPFGDLSESVTPWYVQFMDGDIGRINAVEPRYAHDDLQIYDVTTMHAHSDVAQPSAPIHRAQHLWVFGSPAGELWDLQSAMSMSGGVYAADDAGNPLWDHGWLVECSACAGGDSGAGVWADDGTLVGTLVAGRSGAVLVIDRARLFHSQ